MYRGSSYLMRGIARSTGVDLANADECSNRIQRWGSVGRIEPPTKQNRQLQQLTRAGGESMEKPRLK